jgi:hypothetical protein
MLFLEVDNFVWLLMLQDETSITLNGLVASLNLQNVFLACMILKNELNARTKVLTTRLECNNDDG